MSRLDLKLLQKRIFSFLQTLRAGGEKSTTATLDVASDLKPFFFLSSLFKIPSVVTESLFPCWFLLLVFHVEMCLDWQWNITEQNDEWILMDSCKNTDDLLFCPAWSHYAWHMRSAESPFQIKIACDDYCHIMSAEGSSVIRDIACQRQQDFLFDLDDDSAITTHWVVTFWAVPWRTISTTATFFQSNWNT